MVMIVPLFKVTKNYWTVYLKMVSFTMCKIDLNKPVKHKASKPTNIYIY